MDVQQAQEIIINFILNFTAIIYEALPFVVLGVVLAGILEEFVPQQLLAGVFQGTLPEGMAQSTFGKLISPFVYLLKFRILAIFLGGFLGLVFPMCECGIIAIMRRLIRKGVPLSVCICYMLCGPIINVVVLLSTYVAFNFPKEKDYLLGGPLNVVLLRAGISFVVAVVTSLIVDWQFRLHGDKLIQPKLAASANSATETTTSVVRPPFRQRLANISETSLHDFVDIMAFLILGACLAAAGREVLEAQNLNEWIMDSPILSILLMMLIAVVFCLCSEADAFVAANFSIAFPPFSKMAFMVLGPMMDIKLYVMYTQIFRQRLIWTIILSVGIQVFVYCLLLHYLIPGHGYSTDFLKDMAK